MKLRSMYEQTKKTIGPRILERKLKSDEVIHHIDYNPFNNENSNLLICSSSYHKWLHCKLKRRKHLKWYGYQVHKMFNDGYSQRQMSEILLVNRSTVQNLWKDLGLKRSKTESEKLKWRMRNIKYKKRIKAQKKGDNHETRDTVIKNDWKDCKTHIYRQFMGSSIPIDSIRR